MKRAIFITLGLLLANPAWAAHHESAADDSMQEKTSTMMEESAPMEESASVPTGSVGRATFTTGIAEREPMDSVTQLTNDNVIVYFFSELNDLAGKTVIHRWEYDGQLMAEVPLAVGGPRWRTYSSKNLEPMWLGEWSVSVLDDKGNVLAKRSMTFTQLDEKPLPASPMPME